MSGSPKYTRSRLADRERERLARERREAAERARRQREQREAAERRRRRQEAAERAAQELAQAAAEAGRLTIAAARGVATELSALAEKVRQHREDVNLRREAEQQAIAARLKLEELRRQEQVEQARRDLKQQQATLTDARRVLAQAHRARLDPTGHREAVCLLEQAEDAARAAAARPEDAAATDAARVSLEQLHVGITGHDTLIQRRITERRRQAEQVAEELAEARARIESLEADETAAKWEGDALQHLRDQLDAAEAAAGGSPEKLRHAIGSIDAAIKKVVARAEQAQLGEDARQRRLAILTQAIAESLGARPVDQELADPDDSTSTLYQHYTGNGFNLSIGVPVDEATPLEIDTAGLPRYEQSDATGRPMRTCPEAEQAIERMLGTAAQLGLESDELWWEGKPPVAPRPSSTASGGETRRRPRERGA